MAMQVIQDDILLTFKEAMGYLRVSRSTLYRLMWSGQLTGHKVGSTWRFYREDLRACVGREVSLSASPSGVVIGSSLRYASSQYVGSSEYSSDRISADR